MTELTPVQTLAGWIVFAQRAGEHGPLFPPRETLEKIVEKRAGRYEEAEAMAQHFLSRLTATTPDGVVATGQACMQFVKGLDKMLGGIMSTPPVKVQM